MDGTADGGALPTDDLGEVVRALAARVEAQEAEITALRERLDPADPAPPVAPAGAIPSAPPAGSGMGRRRLLVGGVGAAAAGVAGVVVSGQPAAAAPGDPFVLGTDNTSDGAVTRLAATNPLAPVLSVQNTTTSQSPSPVGIEASTVRGTAVQATSGSGAGVVAETGNGVALDGWAQTGGIGVRARSAGYLALWAEGVDGIQVNATGGQHDDGVAVAATSSRGASITAKSQTGNGVEAEGEIAVLAVGDDVGVQASGAHYGVEASTESGYAVDARADTGVAVTATSAQYIGLEASGPLVGAVVRGTQVHLHLENLEDDRGAPTADDFDHTAGSIVLDGTGRFWACVASGNPGTWRTIAGPATTGQLHLLPTPVRVYDSRPDGVPAIGPKTKLAPENPRTLDCRANDSGVPAGATGVEVALLVVNAPAGNGNLTIWAGDVTRPAATTTMVWGGDAGRFSSPATTRVSAAGKVQVVASVATHLALDVVGYYL
ncbi:MAG TPA: hypothetical protein VK507_07900 [Iamia sp.]|nr:hypothetical protein [Iamia sp.]